MTRHSQHPVTRRVVAFVACLAAVPTIGHAASEKTLHAFEGQNKGGSPDSPLVHFGNGFYGTTLLNSGTVFFVEADGSYHVRYAFPSYAIGAVPRGGLVNVSGVFYGTTLYGGGSGCGGNGCGSVYSITPGGAYTMLYAFKGGKDGNFPSGTLVVQNGLLYGTTMKGGTGKAGTVFSVSPQGAKSTLYAFQAVTDGSQPSGLITDGTNLYGTTNTGAGTSCENSAGCGTVFTIDPQGQETTLHIFGDGLKGGNPSGRLLLLGDQLYGTTVIGGKDNYGTTYRVSRTGAFKLLHAFTLSDGAYPAAGLIDVGGALYGTTYNGGAFESGTIFSMTRSGKLSTLYSFQGGDDGAAPGAELLDYRGTLYGTTEEGGGKGEGTTCEPPIGCGTVFAFTP